MVNTYLNLNQDDLLISNTIEILTSQLNSEIPNSSFRDIIIELDEIDSGGLSEYDEEIILEKYDSLYYLCPNQIEYHMSDTTPLKRGETFGEFMYFLKSINF